MGGRLIVDTLFVVAFSLRFLPLKLKIQICHELQVVQSLFDPEPNPEDLGAENLQSLRQDLQVVTSSAPLSSERARHPLLLDGVTSGIPSKLKHELQVWTTEAKIVVNEEPKLVANIVSALQDIKAELSKTDPLH